MTSPTLSGPTLIQSLRRGLVLLDTVVRLGPTTARALSVETQIPLPTTYRLLRTLVIEGFLDRDEGSYEIGRRYASTTQQSGTLHQLPAVYSELCLLSRSTASSACLVSIGGDQVISEVFVPGRVGPAIDWWPGTAIPLHATAMGKAVLGQMPRHERESLIRSCGPLPSLTLRTITDVDQLLADVDERRVCETNQEDFYGVSSMAVGISVPGFSGAVGVAIASSTLPSRRARVIAKLIHHTEVIRTALSDGLAVANGSRSE